jgi:hypothetical protein
MEPPVSVPSESVARPAASAAPLPLEEPPGSRSRFQGLRAGPKPDSVPLPVANSSRLSLPSITAPAASSRATAVAVTSGTLSAPSFEPCVVRMPRVAKMSLGAKGTPSSLERGLPFA